MRLNPHSFSPLDSIPKRPSGCSQGAGITQTLGVHNHPLPLAILEEAHPVDPPLDVGEDEEPFQGLQAAGGAGQRADRPDEEAVAHRALRDVVAAHAVHEELPGGVQFAGPHHPLWLCHSAILKPRPPQTWETFGFSKFNTAMQMIKLSHW